MKNFINLANPHLFFPLGEYVCEIETYGSPLSQTSTLEILGNYDHFIIFLES